MNFFSKKVRRKIVRGLLDGEVVGNSVKKFSGSRTKDDLQPLVVVDGEGRDGGGVKSTRVF